MNKAQEFRSQEFRSQEHPNGLTRVKILEATGEGADLAVAEKSEVSGR